MAVLKIVAGSVTHRRETAFTFAEAGAVGIAFADLNHQSAQEAAKQVERLARNSECRAIAIATDVMDEASAQAVVEKTVKDSGRTDYSVNNVEVRQLYHSEITG